MRAPQLTDLERARAEIDRIDAELAALFEARMEAVRTVAAWKEARGLPIRDPDREREVLSRNLARLEDPELRPLYAEVLEALLDVSRRRQQTWREAGGAGTEDR